MGLFQPGLKLGLELPHRLFHPVFEIGARFGNARLTFLQKPVSAHDLLLLLRLRIGDGMQRAKVC